MKLHGYRFFIGASLSFFIIELKNLGINHSCSPQNKHCVLHIKVNFLYSKMVCSLFKETDLKPTAKQTESERIFFGKGKNVGKMMKPCNLIYFQTDENLTKRNEQVNEYLVSKSNTLENDTATVGSYCEMAEYSQNFFFFFEREHLYPHFQIGRVSAKTNNVKIN